MNDWTREFDQLQLGLDLRGMGMDESSIAAISEPLTRAIHAMADLEAGAIANPTENRMVGHYWLRSPDLAPGPEIRDAVAGQISAVEGFAKRVLDGAQRPVNGDRFTDVVHIGIGGSALGPQLLLDALGRDDGLRFWFVDNTDPDGMDRILSRIGARLATTLLVAVSKSGSTRETANGLAVFQSAIETAGLDFPSRAASISCEKSLLDARASEEGWAGRFLIWDWVGGRTSVTSAVGLLPAFLAGIDGRRFLAGAAACDAATRVSPYSENPAAMLAAAWYVVGSGAGDRSMVVLPYRDRLALFGRYLQQLVMESLGKTRDLDNRPVRQGLTVYGNKGTTDQHAFVQQLRDGRDDFFVTFVRVLSDASETARLDLGDGLTCGDYLDAFLLGTRAALRDAGRPTMTLTLSRLDAFGMGVLVALFERAVGLYAQLIRVNAYDQPGVEAGKKAAAGILDLQSELLSAMRRRSGEHLTAKSWAESLSDVADASLVFDLLRRLAADPTKSITYKPAEHILDGLFGIG